MRLHLEHSYAGLPARFFAELPPARVARPALVVFNRDLARELGLDVEAVESRAANLFSGNSPPQDSRPLAMAYAGHQFGHFVPQLGDGRALLLGELVAPGGRRFDLQLKGSGPTPFSRAGDGRAALGPMLREYLISEAMHALGIPTTRSLAVVATGERVVRDELLPGAVLTRIASSHIRVGTFEFFAARADLDALRTLLDYVVARHFPEAADDPNPALSVLRQVTERQLALIADWMRVGFIHGVMNTDNMALSGETIDYGPCAFMDAYHPDTVFSSIDRRGRYAYANQPAIAQWNLARFAETLLPLIDTDGTRAVEKATAVLSPFVERLDARLDALMAAKLGLHQSQDGDARRVRQWLAALQQAGADFTLSFRRLADVVATGDATPLQELRDAVPGFDQWLEDWQARLAREPLAPVERAAAMRRVNPAFIPRNHRVESALRAAAEGDLDPFHRLLGVLRRPCEDQPENLEFTLPPTDRERVVATFCGT